MLQPALRWGTVLILGQVFMCLAAGQGPSQAADVPKLDKEHLVTYLRYAEAWAESVEATAGDPKPSPIPGFYEVTVHLKFPSGKLDRVYYLSNDGKSLVSGNLYDLTDSPFKLNLSKLNIGTNAPSKGPDNAPVTIVVFGDFQCPYCKDESKLLTEDIPKKYPKEVRIVFKDFPLEIHPWARKAAIAGRCVIEQNPAAYWPYHESMYAHQSEINVGNLDSRIQEFASQQKLDSLRLTTCVESKATAGIVEANEAEGRALAVSQTPTLFINGRMVAGALPLEKLEVVIQWELKRQVGTVKTGSDKCCEANPPSLTKH